MVKVQRVKTQNNKERFFITLPKDLVESLNLKKGDQLILVNLDSLNKSFTLKKNG
jgi:bifunctional DNA-binding transcriptional regulator/antitoxin component of YhaV-PrlF toxin-antitoxin module